MKKTILILGVGPAQVDAIVHCKDNGHEVIGISYRHEGQGLDYLDHFEKINISDKEGVLEYARRISADLIYSVGSDLAVSTIAYVSEKLGTPYFVNEQTAELLQNKGRFRHFLEGVNISPLPFNVAGSLDDLLQWKVFPAVIKPVDSQGQRGVYEIQHPEQLPHCFEKSFSYSRSQEVIVEKFIDGPEISVNAFVQDGTLRYSFITDRFVVEHLPGGIVRGHGIPARIRDNPSSRVQSLTEEVIRALDIRNGPVYIQLKYTEEDVFIIEVAPRLDGCHLWRLIELKYSVDLLRLSFQLLENTSPPPLPEIRPVRQNDLYLEFFLQKPQTLFKKTECKEDHEVLCQHWYYKTGETVRPINEYIEKTGYQIICRK